MSRAFLEAMVKWEGHRILADVLTHTEDGLKKALEHLLSESRKIVPYKTGHLSDSGGIDIQGREGSVFYDTPYAVEMHENLAIRHPNGRKAKYLERPALDQAGIMFDKLGKAVELN